MTLVELCEYYYLDIKTVRGYIKRHPEITENDVIKYYIHSRKHRDMNLVKKTLNNITGINPIDILELDARTYNALRRAGIHTLEHIKIIPICILEQLPNIGAKSIDNIVRACNSIGIQLREV